MSEKRVADSSFDHPFGWKFVHVHMYASKMDFSRTGKHWAGQRVHVGACNAAVMQDDF